MNKYTNGDIMEYTLLKELKELNMATEEQKLCPFYKINGMINDDCIGDECYYESKLNNCCMLDCGTTGIESERDEQELNVY